MILDHPNILPECFVDTNLIQYLMNGTVNHQHNCNKVVGTLKNSFSDRFAVGIIDKDKVEVGYLKDCDEILTTEHLSVMKHKSLPHYLFTVKPAIDRFLLDCAKEQAVRPEDYGLSSSLKEFTKQSKKKTSSRDPNFRGLIIAIKANKEIVFLRESLRYLQDNKYDSNPESIRAMAKSLSLTI